MSEDFDVTRATAIIERALEHGVMEAMPQSDADRIVEAEKVVELARQTEAVKEAWVKVGGEEAVRQHVPGWAAAEAILIEANVFVGSNGSTPDLPSAPSRSDGEPSGQAGSTESAPPPSAPSTSAPPSEDEASIKTTTFSQSSSDPVKDEVWADAQGVEWLVLSYTGGPMVEVMKVLTGEQTVAPAGMLKRRVRVQENETTSAQQMRPVIDHFDGPYEFLSNFSPSPIEIAGITYPTVEHAFQAWKTLDEALHKRIAALPTPGEAKKVGREVVLREGWDEGVRVDVMRGCLELKFAEGSDLARRLVETGDKRLVEGNTWGDTYWGICDEVGENMLGRLLEERRRQLKGDQPEKDPQPTPQEEPPELEVVITSDPGQPDPPEDSEPKIVPDHPLIDAAVSDMPKILPSEQHVPEHDDEGDDRYQDLLDETEERYTPSGMPVPRDLKDPPDINPAVFDELPDREARAMHSRFNALAARAKYLHDIEDARARECDMLRKLYMRGAMSRARQELGSKATEAHVKELAEETDEDVSKWGDRASKHAGQASAFKTFFDIYSQHVVVLSRDWTMREKQMNS